jgi:hypothetical protein
VARVKTRPGATLVEIDQRTQHGRAILDDAARAEFDRRNAGAALGSAARRAVCLVGADRDSRPLIPQGSSILPRKAKDCLSVHKGSPVSSINAQRKHAKATKRKKILEQRHRLEAKDAGGGLARKVRRAAAAPLHACLVQHSVFQSGVGMVFLSRKIGARDVALGGFLVDAYCLGVKDAMFCELDEGEMKQLLDEAGATAPLTPVDPSYARKLLRDAAAYAQSLGLPPHPDHATVELLFGDVVADACDVEFQFGHEGRPLYVPGPTESPAQIRRRIDRLRRRLGDDGFDFGLPEDAIDMPDELTDDEMDYDPDVGPDPAHWLALEEAERLRQAKDYHRRCDVLLANPEIHAAVHVAIENQIAMGDEMPVRGALERLMAEGLTRHEAVHALGSVLTEMIVGAADGKEAEHSQTDAYNDGIARITAEDWRRLAADD